MKVYTKTGDKGETGLFGGKRVSKSSIRVEAYGTVDELNSAIGVAIAEVHSSQFTSLAAARRAVRSKKTNLKKELIRIQHDLLDIGSTLASPTMNRERITVNMQKRVKEFEKLIDTLTVQLPELRQFILPGGGKTGSQLHLTRTICRRAERRVVELNSKEQVDSSILQYFNRLSDLLFTMARFVNFKEKKKETLWQLRKEK